MKTRFPAWGLVGFLALGLVGCSKNATSVGSRNAKLFQSADPKIKAQWETAMAAMKTNGFVTAIVSLQNLQQASLTPEQLNAVKETVTAVSDQMYEAANKGDASATQAIQEMRKASGR